MDTSSTRRAIGGSTPGDTAPRQSGHGFVKPPLTFQVLSLGEPFRSSSSLGLLFGKPEGLDGPHGGVIIPDHALRIYHY